MINYEVEGVCLITSSFQFFTRLAAVFAEEVCGFGFLSFNLSLRAFPHDH